MELAALDVAGNTWLRRQCDSPDRNCRPVHISQSGDQMLVVRSMMVDRGRPMSGQAEHLYLLEDVSEIVREIEIEAAVDQLGAGERILVESPYY